MLAPTTPSTPKPARLPRWTRRSANPLSPPGALGLLLAAPPIGAQGPEAMRSGMPRMPKRPETAGYASVSSLAKRARGRSAAAALANSGAIIRQGPHQAAQKSTTSGSSSFRTALSRTPGSIARTLPSRSGVPQVPHFGPEPLLRHPVHLPALEARQSRHRSPSALARLRDRRPDAPAGVPEETPASRAAGDLTATAKRGPPRQRSESGPVIEPPSSGGGRRLGWLRRLLGLRRVLILAAYHHTYPSASSASVRG